MSDDFCLEHGYEFMRYEKVWGAIPYCEACDRMKENQMPGDISRSHKGPGPEAPYVPSWCYPHGPKMCPCGHHEGYHNDKGLCLLRHECACKRLPIKCRSTDREMLHSNSLGEGIPTTLTPAQSQASENKGGGAS